MIDHNLDQRGIRSQFILCNSIFNCTVLLYIILYLFLYLLLRSKVFILISESVKSFTKIRGIKQNACYCLFSTDLNKIFHIKYVHI